jgi:spermidine/putrescine transport system ATP-binding protein
MLELVGLPDAFEKRPHQLSGGQKQRVALARALAVDPAVLLLDEPLGALDLKLRRQMQDELKQLQRRIGTTFVHVTHDQEEAMAIADTIVVLNKGRIEDVGPPDRIYLKPRTRFTADFMGLSALIDGFVESAAEAGVMVRTPIGVIGPLPMGADAITAGDPVTLSFRPEDIRIASVPGTIALGQAIVEDIAFIGAHRKIGVRHGVDDATRLTLLLPHETSISAAEPVTLHVRPKDVCLLTR